MLKNSIDPNQNPQDSKRRLAKTMHPLHVQGLGPSILGSGVSVTVTVVCHSRENDPKTATSGDSDSPKPETHPIPTARIPIPGAAEIPAALNRPPP